MAVADGSDGFPPLSPANDVLFHLATAPGPDDHVRVCCRNPRGFYNPALRGDLMPQIGEYRYATGDLNQFFHPTDPTNQRIHPFFEEYSWTARKPSRRRRNPLKTALQLHR